MAHELDFNADGSAAMFSVEQTPWHGLGKILSDAPRTVPEALAAASLDWEVETRAAHFEVTPGDFLAVPNARIVVRQDRNVALGVVSDAYTPLQNRDALAVFEPLIDQGLATFETAGALKEGRHIWAQIRFNITDPTVQEFYAGEITPMGLVTNSHDGHRGVLLMDTDVRVVCWNTLGQALRGRKEGRNLRIPHRRTVEARLTKAAMDLWAGIVERRVSLARQYQALRRRQLNEALFRRLVLDVALPLPEAKVDSPMARKMAETRIVDVTDRRRKLRALWEHGLGHTGDGSAWEAYNAVTEATDHDRGIFDVKGEDGNRATSLLEGKLGRIKAEVWDALMGHLALAA